MKKYLKAFGACAISLALLVGCTGDKMSKTVLSVNGENVKYEEYLKKFAIFKLQLDMTFGKEFWNEKVPASQTKDGKETTILEHFKGQILDKITDDKIVAQEAKKQGVKVDENELNKILEQSLKNIESDKILKQYYADNKIDKEFMKFITTEDLTKAALEKNFTEKNKVTQDEIDKYFVEHKADFTNEQLKASHIIIRTQDDAGNDLPQDKIDAAKKQMDEIYAKFLAGADFATLAKQYSQDGSKETGGDLGYFGRGQMDKTFEDVAFGLKVGETSKPFKSKFGYHIVKLTDKKTQPVNEKEVKQFIKDDLQRKKFADYLEKLKKEAKITKKEDLIKDVDKDVKPAVIPQQNPTANPKPEGNNQAPAPEQKSTTETKK